MKKEKTAREETATEETKTKKATEETETQETETKKETEDTETTETTETTKRKEFYNPMSRTIITVVGKDTVGIIARICTYLAEHNINIQDISQTILQGFFNMIMVVDASGSELNHEELSDGLSELGEKIGITIHAQKEEIFDMMHRV